MNTSRPADQITSDVVRDSFNDINVVIHYTRAAHQLGLWASERLLIERWFPDRTAPLLEVGCGAGRVAFGLWDLGYRDLTAVDFAEALLDQARSLAGLRLVDGIRFFQADATTLSRCHLLNDKTAGGRPDLCNVICDEGRGGAAGGSGSAGGDGAGHPPVETLFAGACFMFNGLMQIPGRENRKRALRKIHALCRPGARFLLTTHDRNDDPGDRPYWADEEKRWAGGGQDPRLVDFGDRWFENDHGGHTFMHLPARAEVLEDLAATGWVPQFDAMRRQVAPESAAVRAFSDECRFWLAQKEPVGPCPPCS
jgi:SAM-dependent methyltransferase